jgi:hypothetical protein
VAKPAILHARIPTKITAFPPERFYVFITWRLWGSLPAKPDLTRHPTPGHAFAAQDRVLDRHASGPRWLHDPRIADIVAEAILIGEFDRRFYQLSAWVVMPNHVHLLMFPMVPVPVLMRWLKGSTARSANRIMGRTGQPFWQDESWDHYLRGSSSTQPDRGVYRKQPGFRRAGVLRGALALVQCRLAGETACPTKPCQSTGQNVETPGAA